MDTFATYTADITSSSVHLLRVVSRCIQCGECSSPGAVTLADEGQKDVTPVMECSSAELPLVMIP